MFSLEIILADVTLTTFGPIVLSSVAATVISRAILGNHPAFMVPAYELSHGFELALYPFLGIIAGLVALVFIDLVAVMEDFFDRVRRIPEYLHPAAGGLVFGLVALFLPHIYATGYPVISLALVGELGVVLLGILIVAKLFGTTWCLGMGASGGVFAPSLFIGAMTGGFFGHIVNALFPGLTAHPGAYALVGMGAVVAGTTQGAITAILILFEMTGDYKIILPMMMTCIIASFLTSQLKGVSIYTIKLARRGINVRAGRDERLIQSLKVADAMTRRQSVETVPEDLPLRKLLDFIPQSTHSNFPVVDGEGKLTGIISLQDFREVAFEKGLEDLVIAKDLASEKVVTARRDESLASVFRKIATRNIEVLPVVDDQDSRQIVGIVSRSDIIKAYNKALLERERISSGAQPPL